MMTHAPTTTLAVNFTHRGAHSAISVRFHRTLFLKKVKLLLIVMLQIARRFCLSINAGDRIFEVNEGRGFGELKRDEMSPGKISIGNYFMIEIACP